MVSRLGCCEMYRMQGGIVAKMNTLPQLKKINVVDLDLPSTDGLRFTHITGDADSICFDTTDHEGGSEEGFELTWPEIFAACKEYCK